MRIGQLARKLGLTPSDILEFLGNQGVETEGGTNSRLSDELVAKVINHFAPEKRDEPITIIDSPIEDEPIVPVVEETVETPSSPPEVIRVAKVELQGLKVVGKIDLPERKKKEPKPEEQPEQEMPKQFRKRNDRREWENPLEQKRLQEARAAEKKRKEAAEKQKEKRTNHYYNKVKSVPTKAVRRFEEQTVVEDVEVKEPPKGLIGRFFHWLRN